jgi:putative FmdB family regulatory protein
MPMYEYGCLGCKSLNEVLTPHGAKAPPCPQCGSRNVRTAFSVFALSSLPCPSERKCESNGRQAACPMSGQCRITG